MKCDLVKYEVWDSQIMSAAL